MNRRLDTVRRVRRIQERLARAEVARCRAALTEREECRDHLSGLVDQHAAHRPASVRSLVDHADMVNGGLAQVASASRQVAVAAVEVETTMAAWTLAARRQEGIDRLADRLAREQRVEDDRLARIELDDLVVTRWESS